MHRHSSGPLTRLYSTSSSSSHPSCILYSTIGHRHTIHTHTSPRSGRSKGKKEPAITASNDFYDTPLLLPRTISNPPRLATPLAAVSSHFDITVDIYFDILHFVLAPIFCTALSISHTNPAFVSCVTPPTQRQITNPAAYHHHHHHNIASTPTLVLFGRIITSRLTSTHRHTPRTYKIFCSRQRSHFDSS